jgi:hypothetical protein
MFHSLQLNRPAEDFELTNGGIEGRMRNRYAMHEQFYDPK